MPERWGNFRHPSASTQPSNRPIEPSVRQAVSYRARSVVASASRLSWTACACIPTLRIARARMFSSYNRA
jgi:hypothetical protein